MQIEDIAIYPISDIDIGIDISIYYIGYRYSSVKSMHIILNSSVKGNVIIECASNSLKVLIFQNVPSLTCPVKLEESMAGQKPVNFLIHSRNMQLFRSLPQKDEEKKDVFSIFASALFLPLLCTSRTLFDSLL